MAETLSTDKPGSKTQFE